jgi:hypothetical protein
MSRRPVYGAPITYPAGMSAWHLAQLNTARLEHPIGAAEMVDFVAALDEVNAVADAAPGFVWRLRDDSGNATALRPFGADRIVNLSVWIDLESLRAYVFDSVHAGVLRRRREWFDRSESVSVLWWVPAGHIPDVTEASQRSDLLLREGPGTQAFTFARAYPAPDASGP